MFPERVACQPTALAFGLPQPLPLVYHGTRLWIYHCPSPWATASVNLGLPLLSPLVSHCPRPWPAIVLTLGLPKKGPCVQGQGSRSPNRVQGLKFPRVPGAEGSRSPKTPGSKGSSYQGSKESKGPRVQGSRGLMVQGSRGTRGSTRTHEVPASRGPEDPRDWVQRTKGPKTQGSKGLEGPRVQRSKGPRVQRSKGPKVQQLGLFENTLIRKTF